MNKPIAPVGKETGSKSRTLDEMLAMCDPTAPRSAETEQWLNAPPVGREIVGYDYRTE